MRVEPESQGLVEKGSTMFIKLIRLRQMRWPPPVVRDMLVARF